MFGAFQFDFFAHVPSKSFQASGSHEINFSFMVSKWYRIYKIHIYQLSLSSIPIELGDNIMRIILLIKSSVICIMRKRNQYIDRINYKPFEIQFTLDSSVIGSDPSLQQHVRLPLLFFFYTLLLLLLLSSSSFFDIFSIYWSSTPNFLSAAQYINATISINWISNIMLIKLKRLLRFHFPQTCWMSAHLISGTSNNTGNWSLC